MTSRNLENKDSLLNKLMIMHPVLDDPEESFKEKNENKFSPYILIAILLGFGNLLLKHSIEGEFDILLLLFQIIPYFLASTFIIVFGYIGIMILIAIISAIHYKIEEQGHRLLMILDGFELFDQLSILYIIPNVFVLIYWLSKVYVLILYIK